MVMADRDGAIQCMLCRIADLAIYEENLLVNPGVVGDGENSWGVR